ncbi:hypothetical protein [Streptomyces sp. NPDC057854]|uniref:hypothetical protein n=1 Tax=unclassified Streptomyces TaxID=2593676 RepID=UPI0036801A0E
MTDIPYGVGGCLCWGDDDSHNRASRWRPNGTCPYHGIVADGFGANRTDTGMYRVVRGDDGQPAQLDDVPAGRVGGRVIAGQNGKGTALEPDEIRSLFWDDHDEDMKDPEYRRAFEDARDTAKRRRYRQGRGHWGVGIARSPGGWHVTVGPWCWTTEPR